MLMILGLLLLLMMMIVKGRQNVSPNSTPLERLLSYRLAPQMLPQP
jgi:hypothetical protein